MRTKHKIEPKLSDTDLDRIIEGCATYCDNMGGIHNYSKEYKEKRKLLYQSTYALLWYSGLRSSEVVGSPPLKWRVLSNEGIRLFRNNNLPKEWWKTEETMGLWVYRIGESYPGLHREDIMIDYPNKQLLINCEPLKGGIRPEPLNIFAGLKYVNLIEKQWFYTKPKERVFPIGHERLYSVLRGVFENKKVHPHTLRHERINRFAENPNVTIPNMMNWMGWARASTADSYISRVRGSKKMGEILAGEQPLPQEA